jgi:hypothetical protein
MLIDDRSKGLLETKQHARHGKVLEGTSFTQDPRAHQLLTGVTQTSCQLACSPMSPSY